MQADLKRIEQEIVPLLEVEAVELVDLRFLRDGGRWVLRFFVDKQGGITLNDCEHLSRRIGGLLDLKEDLVHGSYVLEISSPGLDRVLKLERDFVRFAGHRAKVRLKVPRAGQRQFRGYLKGVEDGAVVLEHDEIVVRMTIDEIDEARLDPDIEI